MTPRYALALATTALLAAACGSGGTSPQHNSIVISAYAFHPDALGVHAGESVAFANRDATAHTATTSSGPTAFDTGTLKPGQSKTISFTRPGNYTYYCQFHAFMRGTIRVSG